MFQAAAWLLTQFYSLTSDYTSAIALVAVVIMMLIFPLTLKSTKSMLEMQKVQPEMKRLQQQHRNDRQKLNEEMMKLYQEHKVNPLASCLPLLAQMPIFLIMFRVLRGLTRNHATDGTFAPDYLSKTSELYRSLQGKTEMRSLGLDLSLTPVKAIQENAATGVVYALLVVALMGLYFVQQRMIASRTVSPTMSASQQKLMQYLPVFFGVFQFFFPVALVVYYFAQTIVRIAQQSYITRRFYKGDDSLGSQAQAAGAKARELAKDDVGGGGMFGQMKKDVRPRHLIVRNLRVRHAIPSRPAAESIPNQSISRQKRKQEVPWNG
ncbi:MAG: YidC/Oxa1 family membrane protein insertase [Actinobacteria bacterium]|nr:YidC/Oxa1 family membrane protein insertase [Actinomycetota bacterium]